MPLIVGTPRRRVVDVAHRSDAGRSQGPFGGTAAIGVAHLDADLRPDIGVAQRVAAGGRAADRDAIAQPLVAERSQALGIADPIGVSGQRLVLGGRAADHRHPARRVVDVAHRSDAG